MPAPHRRAAGDATARRETAIIKTLRLEERPDRTKSSERKAMTQQSSQELYDFLVELRRGTERNNCMTEKVCDVMNAL